MAPELRASLESHNYIINSFPSSKRETAFLFILVNFEKNFFTVQRRLLQHGQRQQIFWRFFFLALGLVSVVCWLATPEPVMSAVDQAGGGWKARLPQPPWLRAAGSRGRPGTSHIKALPSPSLPERQPSLCLSKPLWIHTGVPADRCDTIRCWLCANQTVTAWPCRCLPCCPSPVANPLPREDGNWFSGPPVEKSCTPPPPHAHRSWISQWTHTPRL